ncbi:MULTISPECIES: LysR family transcriptional regulator [Cetobacterium]|uniref:LysR family transcriptional regulator n=1 Tax=Cetobacterium TaxID=180162 RepID=UPI0003F83A3B|nr:MULTISPECIES: LysR family transcriptional regulator [Cetobacterium]MBC2853142.1 LysR family transcriptional regulator [Cetobacterium sp. 2G large]MCQ9625412.1 LysR family transcriptional regulator [Cetobacterium somerae]MCX3066346.1 LysR family transcriptional regulator [Cetobacterium somerae]UPO96819.1 LysR family transcriptional regulator [Cetobacterium somerae]WVJ01315.1 LysR family transcriptional regulator [Cetobacterium somerae]
MDLHYLRIFYEVAKEKSFTKAANKLYINQSAVSIQVKKFEEILNSKLFDRSSKKIKLTYTGEALFKMAEEIFEKVKRAEKEMERIINLDKAKISIGATSVIGEPLLPLLMKDFISLHDEIEYDITISTKAWLLKLLKEGELDILLIDEEHITDPNLEVITVGSVPYILVGTKNTQKLETVSKEPLISRKNIYNNDKAISHLEDKNHICFNTKIPVLGNLGVIKGMVKEGIGNVILPYYAVYKEIQSDEFKVIRTIDEVTDSYQIVITKDKKNLAHIIKFINFVKNFKL